MIDLETDEPTLYWTLESIADYESNDDKVWKADRLGPPVLIPTGVSFDNLSDDWEPAGNPIKMTLEPDGYYHSRNQRHHYYGLKSETPTHIIIVGRWRDTGVGRGVFVAVLPNARNSK